MSRAGRELALHLLYQMEVRSETLDQVLPEALVFLTPDPPARAFAVRLVEYALELRDRAEELLKETARNWDPSRFALIDRCVLRLAVAELSKFPESPTNQVIDQFIDLAKSYSTESSGRFVNGVLDPIAKKVRA
ncbi:MAG: transcription antitermination factor NusB [Fibrobacteria bacterium]|nr:transcription antitermination factor NusB [Fibrobacteria bacterium]